MGPNSNIIRDSSRSTVLYHLNWAFKSKANNSADNYKPVLSALAGDSGIIHPNLRFFASFLDQLIVIR